MTRKPGWTADFMQFCCMARRPWTDLTCMKASFRERPDGICAVILWMDNIQFRWGWMKPHCGWTTSTSHDLETMGNHCSWVFTEEPSFQGFLGGAKWISSIHSMNTEISHPSQQERHVFHGIRIHLEVGTEEAHHGHRPQGSATWPLDSKEGE